MDKRLNFELVYCALGVDYVVQALASAMSLKIFNPVAQATLVTDQREKVQSAPRIFGVFDKIYFTSEARDDNRLIKTSLYGFGSPERAYGCAMDCDTLILGDLSAIFRQVDYFDVAMRLLPNTQEYSRTNKLNFLEVKDILPGIDAHQLILFNSGVIYFKKSIVVEELFSFWNRNYALLRDEKGLRGDQVSLAKSVFEHSGVRVLPVSVEWNGNFQYAWESDASFKRRKVLHYKSPRHLKIQEILSKVIITWSSELQACGKSLEISPSAFSEPKPRGLSSQIRRGISQMRRYFLSSNSRATLIDDRLELISKEIAMLLK